MNVQECVAKTEQLISIREMVREAETSDRARDSFFDEISTDGQNGPEILGALLEELLNLRLDHAALQAEVRCGLCCSQQLVG